ncbi:unnamed protein product, partial [Vitis vinifera]
MFTQYVCVRTSLLILNYFLSFFFFFFILCSRRRWTHDKQIKGQELARNSQGDSWERVSQIRDKFEYDRERRMREKAFAPMTGGMAPGSHQSVSRNQRFDAQRYFSQSESE